MLPYSLTIRETLNSSGVAALPPILVPPLALRLFSGSREIFWVGFAQPRQGTGQHQPILSSVNAFLAMYPAESTTNREHHCLYANNDHQKEAKMGKLRYRKTKVTLVIELLTGLVGTRSLKH